MENNGIVQMFSDNKILNRNIVSINKKRYSDHHHRFVTNEIYVIYLQECQAPAGKPQGKLPNCKCHST